jgi:hypothetical protein
MVNLLPHQLAALKWFIQSPNRGLFMIHGTGSGKTLSAIAIAEHMKRYRECIVIAPRSLRDNFLNQIKWYGNVDISRYRFVSSNASNMIEKLETAEDDLTGINVKSLQLDNKLIIVDEVHNLLVGMHNGSKNASALYDMLMSAKSCRIILMTASAVINNIYEVVPALNICKGYIWTDTDERTTLLPERQEDFYKYFVDAKTNKIKNADKLRNRMRGLISYKGPYFERKVLSFYQMLNSTIKTNHYPDRLPIQIKLIPMSTKQYGAYEQAREKERLELRLAKGGTSESDKRIVLYPHTIDGGELKKDSLFGKGTSYRMQSRQTSNIWYPDEVDTATVNASIDTYSPKIESIGMALKPGMKTLIYSSFIHSGITPMASYLEYLGYERFQVDKAIDDKRETDKQEIEKKLDTQEIDDKHETEKELDTSKVKEVEYYGVYTGSVSTDDRAATLGEYNKQNSSLTILLISSSGAEGLSTKGTRHIHIMESYWNWERMLQVMARGIRYNSHNLLPEEDRNVQVCIYLAVAPKNSKIIERSTDVHLFMQSVRKYEANAEMSKLMASVSVECNTANTNINFDCYRCEPRNAAPLFLNDLDQDMRYPLPCKRDSTPIEAKEATINGQLYYVTSGNRVFIRRTNPNDKEYEYVEIVDHDIKQWILDRLPFESSPTTESQPDMHPPHRGFDYPPVNSWKRTSHYQVSPVNELGSV